MFVFTTRIGEEWEVASLYTQCSTGVHVPGCQRGQERKRRKRQVRQNSLFRGQLHLAGNSGRSGTEGRGSILGPYGQDRDELCTGGLSNYSPKKVNDTTSTAKTSRDDKFQLIHHTYNIFHRSLLPAGTGSDQHRLNGIQKAAKRQRPACIPLLSSLTKRTGCSHDM